MSATAPSPGVTGLVPKGHTEMVPIEHETSERVVRTMVFALPPAALAFGGWLAWGRGLHWQDLIGLGILYTLTGLGITVGYHRLCTHRSFKTGRTLRALLAVLGSMAVEGPVMEWLRPIASTTASLTTLGTRTALTSTTDRDGAGRCGAWATPTSAGCFVARTSLTRPATPRISSPTAILFSSAACFRSGCCSDWPSRSASAWH